MSWNGNRVKAFTIYAMWVPIISLGLMLYWPIKTVEFINPFPVETKKVIAGHPVKYRIVGEKYISAAGWVGRNLVGPNTYNWQYISAAHKAGRYNELSNTTIIPAHIEPGRYRIDLSFSYKVNFLRTITRHYSTEYFDVVAARQNGP